MHAIFGKGRSDRKGVREVTSSLPPLLRRLASMKGRSRVISYSGATPPSQGFLRLGQFGGQCRRL